ELYLQKYPKLGLKLVDGTSLAAAVVANSIPQGTDQVVLSGNISKVACAVAAALCKKNIKVIITNKQDYHFLQPKIPEDAADNLLLSKTGIAKGVDNRRRCRCHRTAQGAERNTVHPVLTVPTKNGTQGRLHILDDSGDERA
uniref:Very-long-chain aldehyde decarbonylase CER1-like C-terminal domain-containing protein n=1 Tax=Aegilops tauschii subsp. strangulata TaxID=200361 RepID=A0A452YDK9_AEGTS